MICRCLTGVLRYVEEAFGRNVLHQRYVSELETEVMQARTLVQCEGAVRGGATSKPKDTWKSDTTYLRWSVVVLCGARAMEKLQPRVNLITYICDWRSDPCGANGCPLWNQKTPGVSWNRYGRCGHALFGTRVLVLGFVDALFGISRRLALAFHGISRYLHRRQPRFLPAIQSEWKKNDEKCLKRKEAVKGRGLQVQGPGENPPGIDPGVLTRVGRRERGHGICQWQEGRPNRARGKAKWARGKVDPV
ncbi:hypothetical protein BV22DRAFT_1043735 [Leucogyrophana mollusca]|uniref:Uncharacterized protein n=1 Tax=Leucogyrophana mollusca TaxID=85980 RepID=A0ACB8BVW7_9AGAM|nr:hypothetical protein BV22DRAFT_1043735 [Leucogyrophana mollusca]